MASEVTAVELLDYTQARGYLKHGIWKIKNTHREGNSDSLIIL